MSELLVVTPICGGNSILCLSSSIICQYVAVPNNVFYDWNCFVGERWDPLDSYLASITRYNV